MMEGNEELLRRTAKATDGVWTPFDCFDAVLTAIYGRFLPTLFISFLIDLSTAFNTRFAHSSQTIINIITTPLTPTLSYSSTSSNDSLLQPPRTPSVTTSLSPASAACRSRSHTRSGAFLEVPRPKTRQRSSSASSVASIRETIDELSGFRSALRHVG
jgi:hypothetical protein